MTEQTKKSILPKDESEGVDAEEKKDIRKTLALKAEELAGLAERNE